VLNPLKERTDWKTPIWGAILILLGALILLSPLGVGQPSQYGFAAGKVPPNVQFALVQLKLRPDDASVILNTAEVLIDQGRLDGNSEAVAAADTMLASMVGHTELAPALRLRAIAQQYLHNFDEALDLLDRTLAIDSQDASALLTRANILLVQGKLSEAQKACQSLSSVRRYDLFVLCDTTAKAIGAEVSAAAQRLTNLIDSGRMDPALEGYAYSVLGEIAMFRGDDMKAQSLLEKAQMSDPENLRIRMLHADSLLNLNRFERAIEVLNVSADTDSLLVRRAIAYKRAGKTEALAGATEEMDRRIQGNLRTNHTGHAREESLYYLEVLGDPAKALERANINWEFQREFEDARLLLESATAANSAGDADKVRTWMRDENVTVSGLVSRLNEVGLNPE
jgi:tetratricopeptide (TPR) repeat protein